MKRVSLLLIIAFVSVLQLVAVPAKRGYTKFVQSDGTTISVATVGDEFYHYSVTSDGYAVVRGADGDFYFADTKDGALVASNVKFKSSLTEAERAVAAKSFGIRPARQTKLGETRASESSAWRAPAKAAKSFGVWGGEMKGSLKGLVILVNFADTKYVTPSPKEAFSEMLNTVGYSKNGGTGSAVDYFVDNSSGAFTPTFDVYGPYTLSKKSSYYAGSDGTANGAEMIADACKAADADIDFSQYAEEGKVRSVFVYYAGYNQAEGGPKTTVWPHQWSVYNPSTTLDGVRIFDYACTSELRGSSGSVMAGIGTFCHEFGHVIGLPDFYDTDDETNGTAFGLDITSVMDYGGYLNDGCTPPAYNILERWMLGWGEPTSISAAGTYTLTPVYDNAGYKIDTSTESEFFLFENRSRSAGNVWDKSLLEGDGSVSGGGGGMLVYHVDYSSSYRTQWYDNDINTYSSHECVKLLRAVPNAAVGNSYSSLTNTKKWYYPGSENVTALNGTTTPKLASWNGVATEYSIDQISESGKDIVLKISTPSAQIVSDIEVVPDLQSAVVTWKSTTEVTSWNITVTSTALATPIKLTSTETTATVTGLSPATTYTVTISAAGDSKEYSANFLTLDPIESITVDQRQYDALLTWKPLIESDSWIVEYSVKGESGTVKADTKDTFFVMDNLAPATAYVVTVRYSASDKGNKTEFITEQSKSSKRSRMNVAYTQSAEGYVRLSVENLHTQPTDIVWYVDSQKVSSSYLQLALGEHTVCAVVTSEENTEYLFRYINVTE